MGDPTKLARRPRYPGSRSVTPEPSSRPVATRASTVLEVVESAEVGGRLLVVVRVLNGELKPEMVLRAADTDECWRITGFAFDPLAALDHGLQGLILMPQTAGQHAHPRAGLRLFADA
jgi:hypothetical protein